MFLVDQNFSKQLASFLFKILTALYNFQHMRDYVAKCRIAAAAAAAVIVDRLAPSYRENVADFSPPSFSRFSSNPIGKKIKK